MNLNDLDVTIEIDSPFSPRREVQVVRTEDDTYWVRLDVSPNVHVTLHGTKPRIERLFGAIVDGLTKAERNARAPQKGTMP